MNELETLHDEIASLRAELAEALEAQRWIAVGERLPRTHQRVNVVFTSNHNKKRYMTMADYIAPRTILAEDYLSDDCDMDFSDYDEENDCYWTPGGWYEYQEMAEMNYYISDTVTHWRPLPEPPTT